MKLLFRHKVFQRFAFSTIFLLSFFLLSSPSLWAQSCGNVGDNCSIDADCNDGDPCNGIEFCGSCGSDVSFPCCQCGTPPADNTVACASDGNFCNGSELCVGGTCSGHTGNPCAGNGECADACSVDTNATSCNESIGTPCTDDGNFCTTDACNGLGSCVSLPNDFLCDDGVNCTENDVCAGGICAGIDIQCTDGVTCTLDFCEETTGLCEFDSGQCECQVDVDCDDGNVCTDEFCCTDRSCAPDEVFTCIRSDNSDPCDDGLFCNGPDLCDAGTCSIHDGDPCLDGGQCDQTCDEIADNCFAPVGMFCDDDDIRTVTQCDGDGKCATIETLNTQGGTIGCSLNPGGEGGSKLGAPTLMIAFGAWILGILNKRKVIGDRDGK